MPGLHLLLLQYYTINYGDELGKAMVELDDVNHTVSITPSNAAEPATLIDFKQV